MPASKVQRSCCGQGRVDCLTFTSSTKHFVTLGGQDDAHLAVWSTLVKKPLIYKVAQLERAGHMYCLAASKVHDDMFATAGDTYGRIWTFNTTDVTLSYTEFKFGSWSRHVITMEIVDLDNSKMPVIMCGTTSGDILVFHGRSGTLQCTVPAKKPFPLGVTTLTYLRMLQSDTFAVVVGTGEGKVGYYSLKLSQTGTAKPCGKLALMEGVKVWSDARDISAVTSISKVGVGHQLYIGTRGCNMYRMALDKWTSQLVRTCPASAVMAIAFPRDTDQLMVTGELDMVRVFNLCLLLEVRRYWRANRTCLTVVLNHDGTHIFSGWDNGETIVLGFEPKELTLTELYRIDTTQKQAVTSLALTSKSDVLVSGGNDGQVRVWRLVDDLDLQGRRLRQGLLQHCMVEHSGAVTMVKVSSNDETCVSTSVDGSAVIHDLLRGTRRLMVKIDLELNGVTFCDDDLHFLTCGTDGKVYYWEVLTGSNIRIVQACSYGPVYCIDLEMKDKTLFATCAHDKMIKLWRVEEGDVTHVGQGHSDTILNVKFGYCGSVLVSGSRDGAICIWDLPR